MAVVLLVFEVAEGRKAARGGTRRRRRVQQPVLGAAGGGSGSWPMIKCWVFVLLRFVPWGSFLARCRRLGAAAIWMQQEKKEEEQKVED